MSVDEDQNFVFETNSNNVAVYATLNQNRKPSAFISRRLNTFKTVSFFGKEAMCIAEEIKRTLYVLGKKKLKLMNDQRTVSYMFHNFRRSKIKNMKIQY